MMDKIFTLFLFALMAADITMSTMVNLQPVIKTTSGTLVGQRTVVNNNNAEVYQFLGVPYAQAPIGQNRFERPKQLMVNNNDTMIMAQQFKPSCMQMKHLAKAINPLLDVDSMNKVSEDCLYLNIYVPVVSDPSPLPVMVWLPGEGFDFADARQFNGAYLASMGKVIVVTVQYRVGVFGFLKENAGIWDQLAALQWIQQNADSFGGNPQDVTLFGRFTGSMSISILLSSPQVINSPSPLFNRAILMSGIAVGNWVFDKKHQENVRNVIQSQGCDSLDCLKTLPASNILDKSGYGWKPFFEPSLIEMEPLDAIRNGKFPHYVDSIMLGSNQFEGSLCLLKHLLIDEPFYAQLIHNNITETDYVRIISEDLQMFYGEDSTHQSGYQQKNDVQQVNNRDSYMQFCSELLIESHMREYDTLLRKIYFNKSYNLINVLQYKVDYKPSFSIAPDFINSSIHGDDVLLAFALAFKNPSQSTENDREISRRMVKLFSDFARNGAPKTTSDRFIYIKLETEVDHQIRQQQYPHHHPLSHSRQQIYETTNSINSIVPFWAIITGVTFLLILFSVLMLVIMLIRLTIKSQRQSSEQIKQLI